MSTSKRIIQTLIAGTTIVGIGYAVMKLATPNPEDVYKKFSPETKRDYEANKEVIHERNVKLVDAIKKSAESDKPIWDLQALKEFSQSDKGVKSSEH
ncbi:225_t:CDS:2 [Paraglomus brasilianum]|uniref:Cytochrome b mRNA-processing protein 4 n=1 Tax=Paraglomus brasilianum TaxID=144538 RepID=A0A9N8WEJ0_9GLOM|nr:225_t:CDS:2 [Paraglomus brasilianum]